MILKQLVLKEIITLVFFVIKSKDAHHIIERKLFDDGGYYLNNAASVCEEHHIECEKTLITVEAVYAATNITEPKRPDYFEKGLVYDKWGNIIVSDVKRIPGLLFEDTAVQKILKTLAPSGCFTD